VPEYIPPLCKIPVCSIERGHQLALREPRLNGSIRNTAKLRDSRRILEADEISERRVLESERNHRNLLVVVSASYFASGYSMLWMEVTRACIYIFDSESLNRAGRVVNGGKHEIAEPTCGASAPCTYGVSDSKKKEKVKRTFFSHWEAHHRTRKFRSRNPSVARAWHGMHVRQKQ
jgi:hypothetical protein